MMNCALRLPVPASTCHPAPVVIAHRCEGQRKVLVADDSRDAAESLAMLLTLEGFDARWVCDGAAASHCFSEFQPDAVILDLDMPVINGYDAARRIRNSTSRAVLLIALSGWTRDADRARSFAAGFDHYVAKPAEYEMLRELL
jgi:DNA-binding response OmpR family regulator